MSQADNSPDTAAGLPPGVRPYDWALEQLHVPEAHRVTRGAQDTVVAVIDLGYHHHPDLDGHLWCNPDPAAGDPHGWDAADEDASLGYEGADPDSDYHRGHHVFVAGEVAAVAPDCPIMIVRVAYGRPASWARGIRYAVDRGARILVIPHAYLTGEAATGTPWFYQGTDFSYPRDNPDIREALDEAYEQDCLVIRGVADNRGRRVLVTNAALRSVMAVGSTNRRRSPADICCSTDYSEVAAPGGERDSDDPTDAIWGCGGKNDYIPFTGGCMAAGFAAGVAALVRARFPTLTHDQVRQIMRNTATAGRHVTPNVEGWDSHLGYGILDAAAAVSLGQEQLQQRVVVESGENLLSQRDGETVLRVGVANRGVFDIDRAAVVAYNGDPQAPAVPQAAITSPVTLRVRQLGHTILALRGLHRAEVEITLTQRPDSAVWLEACSLDVRGSRHVHTVNIELDQP